MQLRHERTEERRKLFKIAEKRQWKRILPTLPQARISQNSGTVQKDNVQITIGNVNTVENKQMANNTKEESESCQNQILFDCDNEQRIEERDDLILNDTSSSRRYDNN